MLMKHCLAISTTAILLALTTACGHTPVTPPTTYQPPQPADTALTSPEPSGSSPMPEPGGDTLSTEWVDEDGYSYDIDVSGASATATVDIADAKPGEAVVEWTATAVVTVTNTTDGRNAPFPNLDLGFIWGMDQIVCAYVAPTSSIHERLSLHRPANDTCNDIEHVQPSVPGDRIAEGLSVETVVILSDYAVVPEELADTVEEDVGNYLAVLVARPAATLGDDGCIADLGHRIIALSTELDCRAD